ncbi:DinB family protein [Amycolatopsis kentuckyensis]|uniref:DinB family protein n=1 Tax=Amycolatopsis kentuckyensis TaxID=218823 RepID=UPI003563AEB4
MSEQPGAGIPPPAAEDHTCAGCGLSYPALTLDAARAIIGSLPDAVAAMAASPQELRHRPAPGRRSALEYLVHRPLLEPMLNDLRARRFRYNDRSFEAVRDELAACAAGLGDEIDRLEPADCARVVIRLPGEHRTARWLVRQAAHEVTHHLEDIRQCLAAAQLGSRGGSTRR